MAGVLFKRTCDVVKRLYAGTGLTGVLAINWKTKTTISISFYQQYLKKTQI